MAFLFLETSALLKVILAENETPDVVKKLERAEKIMASRLIQTEAERTIIRLVLDHPQMEKSAAQMHHNLRSIWSRIDFIEITRPVCELAGRIAPRSRLRTLDAIHLASFQLAMRTDPKLEMLTFDERILRELS